MEAIQRLKAERLELIARLSKIEAVLAEHAAVQKKLEELLGAGTVDTGPVVKKPTTNSEGSESRGRRVTADVEAFERAIREILLVVPKPMNRTELLELCIERGIHVGGQEPLNTLASRMSRMENVTNVRGQGYFLKERLAELTQKNKPFLENSPNIIGAMVAAAVDKSEDQDSENDSHANPD